MWENRSRVYLTTKYVYKFFTAPLNRSVCRKVRNAYFGMCRMCVCVCMTNKENSGLKPT